MKDHSATIDKDESALKAMLDAQQDAWNAGDATAWGMSYVDDADFVNILGQAMQGRASMVERHARIFAGPFKGSHVVISVRKLLRIAPEVTLIDTLHEVSKFAFLPPGIVASAPGILTTLMKYVAVKRGDDWKFLAAQNTAIMPLPSP